VPSVQSFCKAGKRPYHTCKPMNRDLMWQARRLRLPFNIALFKALLSKCTYYRYREIEMTSLPAVFLIPPPRSAGLRTAHHLASSDARDAQSWLNSARKSTPKRHAPGPWCHLLETHLQSDLCQCSAPVWNLENWKVRQPSSTERRPSSADPLFVDSDVECFLDTSRDKRLRLWSKLS